MCKLGHLLSALSTKVEAGCNHSNRPLSCHLEIAMLQLLPISGQSRCIIRRLQGSLGVDSESLDVTVTAKDMPAYLGIQCIAGHLL